LQRSDSVHLQKPAEWAYRRLKNVRWKADKVLPGDSEVGQLAGPLKCRMARMIAVEESVTGD